ncbi:iron ABC transporter substrate-binding protein [Anaerobacillus alkalidiazotrophicus]|uniref:Iron ABC transporter substrate-binding protein n=1 Tax=Anaerobacillus alkalidiazotrophicus TaxID=472963 RepID=A0A1S2M8Y8_9BACI|nr:ABC transporter substrate-binding protein [Anaerobacillus alkalidiazotrophicus]OIJ20135.1 iron ABC transporter substrate-binding protein [Anaerobacillus alkalidiazotrophicus]
MKKKLYLALILFMVISLVVACSSSGTGGSAGKLTVYIGFQEDHAVEAMKQFTEDTGIEVDMIRMSAGEILAKIRAEKDNPQADIWYGGPADTFVAAVDEGLLQPYHSPVADKIDARFKDADGYWTGIYVGALGFATNKDFLENHGLEAPTTWEDLLHPAYQNEIIMAHPGSSGTAYTILYTVLKVFGGEDEGFDYLHKLHPQVQQYTTSGSAPGRMVGMGEAGAGLLFAHDIIKYQEEGFDSLVLTIPEDGTGYETGAVAIIEGAPQSELAEKFIDWSLDTSAQEVGQRTGSYQNLTNPDAKEPEKAVKLENINTINYDPIEAGSERSRLIDKWDREVNK